MRRLIKSLCVFLLALTMGIFSIITYGYYFVPNEFSVTDSEKIYINDIITVSIKNEDDIVAVVKEKGDIDAVADVSLFKLFPIKESKSLKQSVNMLCRAVKFSV